MGYVSRTHGIAGSYGNPAFNLLRLQPSVFRRRCAMSRCHQRCPEAPTSPPWCHPSRCEVVSPGGLAPAAEASPLGRALSPGPEPPPSDCQPPRPGAYSSCLSPARHCCVLLAPQADGMHLLCTAVIPFSLIHHYSVFSLGQELGMGRPMVFNRRRF